MTISARTPVEIAAIVAGDDLDSPSPSVPAATGFGSSFFSGFFKAGWTESPSAFLRSAAALSSAPHSGHSSVAETEFNDRTRSGVEHCGQSIVLGAGIRNSAECTEAGAIPRFSGHSFTNADL